MSFMEDKTQWQIALSAALISCILTVVVMCMALEPKTYDDGFAAGRASQYLMMYEGKDHSLKVAVYDATQDTMVHVFSYQIIGTGKQTDYASVKDFYATLPKK